MPETTAQRSLETPGTDVSGKFRHEALLYQGDEGFLEAAVPFLQESLDRDEPVLAVVSRHKVDLLRAALGSAGEDSGLSWFADMAEAGQNPARIISAWRSFLDEHALDDRLVRGIAEPVWASRSSAELTEAQRHESLLNTVFGASEGPDFWLLCPYDTATLPEVVVQRARRDHPFVLTDGVHGHSPSWAFHHGSDGYRSARHGSNHHDSDGAAADGLSEPARELAELTFKAGLLGVMREVVAVHASRFGMGRERANDLIVAVNEVATNSVVHGGGRGVFRLWREAKSLVCEIADDGQIEDPLAGQVPPRTDSISGRGLWLANQLCDLVQIRFVQGGSIVRLHMTIDGD